MKALAIVLCACCPPAPTAPAVTASTGLDTAGMDTSIKPGDDFFGYANGAWLARTEIPADRSSFGTFAIIEERTTKRTADLIQEAAAHAKPGSEEQKIGDYYASYMDEAAIEAAGLEPMQPYLAAVDAIAGVKELSSALGDSLRADVDVLNNTEFDTGNLFGLWVAQDLDDPTQYSPFLLQGGLLLPDRDYYLDASPRMAETRAAYEAHIGKMLSLAHRDPAAAKAILALETKIAQAHAPRTDTEDVHKGNNHWARADFAAKAPGIDWDAYFGSGGLGPQQRFVVWQPGALVALSALVASEDLATWKAYLAYHAIEHAADVLPKAFAEEHFEFFAKTLNGVPEQEARWKRAMAATDNALGEAVGKLYVAKYFPPEEKARVQKMVQQELAAFAVRIDGLAWMSPATKQKAKAKLAALEVGIGYPDKWRDYSGLAVKRGDAYGNLDRAERFERERNLAKLGRPVDRGEWVMNPQLVNAVNLPAMNALNFPAAILQEPFLDPKRPLVMDFGGTGATIGHEISHSFDDSGALFDATGKMQNWWTPEDFEHFAQSSAALAREFDAYAPYPDAHVDGKLTSSENIADVAGLATAYAAYRAAYGGKEAPTVGGFTGDQQFFISFAQSWRNKMREAAERKRLITDGHALPRYRASTVRNLDAWYDAFHVEPGQKLYLAPDQRVKVW